MWLGDPATGTEVWFSVDKQQELPERRVARRVLLVEDDVETADMLSQVLGRLGHRCVVANSATQALELVRAGCRPEVAVVDLCLPDRSGYELVAELKQLVPEANYVALTGESGGRSRLKAKDAGFDFFTLKPANIELLNALIA